jgi:ABC-type transport system involved in multi-copper enzyme maturation permease subunit
VIRRVLLIARREWLEQLRQPWMIAVITVLFSAIGLLVLAALGLLNHIDARPELGERLTTWLPFGSDDPEALIDGLTSGTVAMSNWLVFTQFLGIVAVLAGHSVLHDHQSGTLPFLLLAPVSRAELLLGKVLGALGWPFVLYVFVSGGAAMAARAFPVTADLADRLPRAPAWMIAFFVGGPLWAMVVAALCAIVSTLSRDVRTAQQAVWFVMFFATFVCGYLLAVLVPEGPLVQAGVAAAGAFATWGAVTAGSQIISRDLRR